MNASGPEGRRSGGSGRVSRKGCSCMLWGAVGGLLGAAGRVCKAPEVRLLKTVFCCHPLSVAIETPAGEGETGVQQNGGLVDGGGFKEAPCFVKTIEALLWGGVWGCRACVATHRRSGF